MPNFSQNGTASLQSIFVAEGKNNVLPVYSDLKINIYIAEIFKCAATTK